MSQEKQSIQERVTPIQEEIDVLQEQLKDQKDPSVYEPILIKIKNLIQEKRNIIYGK